MATPEDKEPGPSIVARVEERWLTPLRRNAFATRTWNAVTVAVICAIYAGVIGWMLYRDAHQPIETAKLEEIPVEIVQPPPPPPPPPKPEQKPPQPEVKQELEKPASSAPRAPSEDKVETERMDEATRAPKAEAPKDGEKAPTPEPPAAPDEANDHDNKAAQTADKDDVLKKDAEALTKLLQTPPQKPPEKVAKAPPKAKPKREKAAVQRLAGKTDLPDYKLARPTKKAPITGGNEDNRYLANVFAKIMSKYRPVAIDPNFAGTVTVAFHVDDDGTILAMQIAQSSGDEELDEAAVAAVSRASPLPPLPPGAPHGLIARIGARSAGRALRMGQDE